MSGNSSMGELCNVDHPYGVCGDSNGVVYVCDHGNDPIKIFMTNILDFTVVVFFFFYLSI